MEQKEINIENPKLLFLKHEFVPLLSRLKPDQKGSWGVMNAQEMVEHFTESVRIASGVIKLPISNEGEKLAKFREFLMTETPFKENTKNPILPETAIPAKHSLMESSIAELQNELDHFFEVNESHPNMTTDNPFFGALTFEQNIQLLHKHAKHHLKQFGIE